MSAGEERAAFIAGLRMLADALERSETIPLPRDGQSEDAPFDFGLLHGLSGGDEFAAIVRALGGTAWKRETRRSGSGEYTWINARGRVGALHIKVSADADQVCEPIEPQPVIERKCPELDALLAETQEGGPQS